MNAHNQKNLIVKLLELLGVASASILFSFPVLAQVPSDTNQQNPSDTNQQNPSDTNQQNPSDTNQQYPSDTNQQNPSNTNQQYPSNTNQQYPANTNQQNPSNTNQQYPANTNQQNPSNTNQQYPANTNQQNPSSTGTNQLNSRQNTFNQYMQAGYTATQQRDYQTALSNFQRALQIRPNNSYAVRAIRNVQGYLQRTNTTAPNNSSR